MFSAAGVEVFDEPNQKRVSGPVGEKGRLGKTVQSNRPSELIVILACIPDPAR